jgi:predicted glycoside hydrolase/deacetylase ChbG (UPF0249 family)
VGDGDARVLIVNCDDLGIYRAVNPAIIEAITRGVATTCSLMTPCPAAADAMALLRRHPEIPLGIHLTVICEYPAHGWGPLVSTQEVPSLLTEDGGFFNVDQLDELMAQARLDELELEFRAQIEAALAAKLEPTHLDWHCYLDGGREDVFELGVALAHEYDPLLDSFSLDVDGKSARYAELLRTLPPGVTQWAVHPALADDEAKRVDPDGWRIRNSDYEFLVSAEAHEIAAQENVVLADYRRMQEVWRAR